MNKIFRVVFSKTHHCLVVVGELTKTHGNSGSTLRVTGFINDNFLSVRLPNFAIQSKALLIASKVLLVYVVYTVSFLSSANASCSITENIVTCIDNTSSYTNSEIIFGLKNYGSVGVVNINNNIGDETVLSDSGVLNKNLNADPATIGISILNNSAKIDGLFYGIDNWLPINSLNNGGTIQSYRKSAVFNNAYIENITNSGTMFGATGGFQNQSVIGSLINSGMIWGDSYGIALSDIDSRIGNLENQSSGTIRGGAFGISNIGSINSLTNAGVISGDNFGIANSGSILNLVNYGSVIGNNSFGVSGILNSAFTIVDQRGALVRAVVGNVDSLTNFGNITGNVGVKNSIDTDSLSGASLSVNIRAIQNSGSIRGSTYGILNGISGSYSTSYQLYASINSLINTNEISGGVYGVANAIGTISAPIGGKKAIVATIGNLSNSGVISGGTYGVYNASTISSLENKNGGRISGGNASIYNAGSIGTLSNAQGGSSIPALNYRGVLPTNYNIIINNLNSYGTLNLLSGSGSTIFNIDPSSTLSNNTYFGVLSGMTSSKIANFSTIYNVWNVFNGAYKWELAAGVNSTTWDLVVAPVAPTATSISSSPTPYQSSLLPSLVLPIFNGGTLQISNSGVIPYDFTVSGNGGVIDQNGFTSTFTGKICTTACDSGSLVFTNSKPNVGGSVILENINAFTGSTTINPGATLALSREGSIANSSKVIGNGTLDISAITSNSATIQSLSGGGAVALGSKTLVISGGGDTFAGSITGSGGLNIAGGSQTLSGNNTFTGGVHVQSGASLVISSASALGTGPINLIGGISTPSVLNLLGSTMISNPIIISGDPVFNIAPGATATIASTISDTGAVNDLIVAGGGTLKLTGVNTYTGPTFIESGSTLMLSGSGSIAQSTSINNSGTLDVSASSGVIKFNGNFIQSALGKTIVGFSPSGFQQIKVGGVAVLNGSLDLIASAGTYSAGKYKLLSSSGLTGAFSSFTSNLSSYTRLGYSLTYGESDVYLTLTPNIADTQQSLASSVATLQNIFTLQNTALTNSFAYDCGEFGANGICISAGGRNTAVSAANGFNSTSGLLIAGYRINPQSRIGAYVDQNLSVNNAGSAIKLGNNTPLIGLFGVWSERMDGAGAEVKVSVAYGQKNLITTRQVVSTSEAGSGGSQLNSQGVQVVAKYGFGFTDHAIVSPYTGMRYTQNNMGGYSESASSSVTAPLTYSALNTNAMTVLAGVGVAYRGVPKTTLVASIGVESDVSVNNGSYSAIGIEGLTPINFNPSVVKTRPTAMLGAYYDVEKNQRLGVTGIYRQEPYQAVQTTTVMATYTIGL